MVVSTRSKASEREVMDRIVERLDLIREVIEHFEGKGWDISQWTYETADVM
jgi:hypothetical protein